MAIVQSMTPLSQSTQHVPLFSDLGTPLSHLRLPHDTSDLVVSRMLVITPSDRISAADALEHSFFDEERRIRQLPQVSHSTRE